MADLHNPDSEDRRFIRLAVLRAAIRLEIVGMKRSRKPSATTLARILLKLPNNISRQSVLRRVERELKYIKDKWKGKLPNPDDAKPFEHREFDPHPYAGHTPESAATLDALPPSLVHHLNRMRPK